MDYERNCFCNCFCFSPVHYGHVKFVHAGDEDSTVRVSVGGGGGRSGGGGRGGEGGRGGGGDGSRGGGRGRSHGNVACQEVLE